MKLSVRLLLIGSMFLLLQSNIKVSVPYSKKMLRCSRENQTRVRSLLTVKLNNFTGQSIDVCTLNELYDPLCTTLTVSNGEFEIPDSLIRKPQIVYINIRNGDNYLRISVNLTKDYDLRLTGDARTMDTFYKSAKWSGKGAAINAFYFAMEGFRQDRDYESKEDFDQWFRNNKRKTDSLYKHYERIYSDNKDPHYQFFKKIIDYQIQFKRLNALSFHAYQELLDKQSSAEVKKYISDNFPDDILKDISDSRYLDSEAYRYLMGYDFSYLFYLVKSDNKIRSTVPDSNYIRSFDKIIRTYEGEAREYVMDRFIQINLLASSNSYPEFKSRAVITAPYLQYIKNGMRHTRIAQSVNEMQAKLSQVKQGDVAPAFSLPDSIGHIYQLTDFRGKVIVLDFWASWCGPCRKETPYFQTLYNRYKSNNQLAFISIAVHDKKPAWLKALQKDQPGWLQLYDYEGRTASDYFANAIPKFVIIDKNGRLIEFHAPGPSDGDKLERLILSYIEARK